MDSDDIKYISLLLYTIFIACFVKVLSGEVKKWSSTIFGVCFVIIVSHKHVLHSLFCTLVNALIIRFSSKKHCHLLSFAFSFFYLIFFRTTVYFGIPYPPACTNLVQMMLTLKLVGLAFEVHDSYEQSKSQTTKPSENASVLKPNLLDIFHYAYCYIGVLTGPYYTYKTYIDYHRTDFYKYAPCTPTVWKKLRIVPLYAILFLIISYYYPVKYAESDEFYTENNFWYRLWYMTPVFISFRMRIYVGLVLSEAACNMAGLGAYPAITQPKPGRGPTVNFELLEKLEKNEREKQKTEYNFETVHNIEVWQTEFNPSVRSSIHYWNMCVQYWMAFVVYKRFPYKAFRTAATFMVSALWHGVYAGYYLCLCAVPFYLPVEDIWEALLRRDATGNTRKMLNVIFWVVRTQAFTYMGMAFCLLSMKNGLRYYGSIYYIYHITTVIGLILGLALKKLKKITKKVPEELKKQ